MTNVKKFCFPIKVIPKNLEFKIAKKLSFIDSGRKELALKLGRIGIIGF